MSTTELGRATEAATVGYLDGDGYTILVDNWLARWHKVDIMA